MLLKGRLAMQCAVLPLACVALWTGLALAGANGGVERGASPGQTARPVVQAQVSKATPAAASCAGGTARYIDCGNGTVSDTETGLIWLKRADCFPESDWKVALQAAAALKAGDCGLADGSAAGEWRLPTRTEWQATIAKATSLGCTFTQSPSLTNDAGTACFGDGAGSVRVGVTSNGYWSSTLGEVHPLLTIFPTVPVASFANLYHGDVITIESQLPFGVWPVRGGSPATP